MSSDQSNPPVAACPPTLDEMRRRPMSGSTRPSPTPRVSQGPASFLEFESPAGLLAVAGRPADPALPPGAVIIGSTRGLGRDPRLSHGGPRRRRHPQDQLRVARLCPGVPRAAARRRARCPRPGRGAGADPRRLQPSGHRWFCRLATRVSFQVASGSGRCSSGAAPPASAIEEWVLGLARPAYAYLSEGPCPRRTATCWSSRSTARRPPRPPSRNSRGARPADRTRATGLQVSAASGPGEAGATGRRKRRKKGDNSKNGRSATLVVMYTLRRGEDGRSARPDQQEGVWDVRFAEVGAGMGAGAGDAPRAPPRGPPRRCRSSSTARRAWSSGGGGCSGARP